MGDLTVKEMHQEILKSGIYIKTELEDDIIFIYKEFVEEEVEHRK